MKDGFFHSPSPSKTGIVVEDCGASYLPTQYASIPDDDEETGKQLDELVEALNELEDVVRVHTNHP